jgi:hypothetical protein
VIDHNILLNRLDYAFGISGDALSWIKSYLVDRTQRVAINLDHSDDMQLKYGVPQDSVLGPTKLRVFADASLLFLGLDCTDDCNQLQKDLDKLVNWA